MTTEKIETKTEKTIDLGIFDLFKEFAGSQKTLHKMWVEPDLIILNEPNVRSLMFTPKEPLFTEEFGINDIIKFTSMVSLFDDVEIELRLPDIIVKNKKGTQILSFKSSRKPSFAEVIASNNKSKIRHESSRRFEEEGKHLEFDLDPETIGKIRKASSIFASGSAVKSIIQISKLEGRDEVNLIVRNEASESIFCQTIPAKNVGKLGEFKASFNSDFLMSGNWKVNIFPRDLIDNTDPEKPCPAIWTHMVDEARGLSMLIVYRNEI